MHSPLRRAKPAPVVRSPVWGALAAGVLLILGACESPGPHQTPPPNKELAKLAGESEDVFGPNATLNTPPPPTPDSPFAAPPGAPPVPQAEGWTIAIASVPGSTRALGEQMVETIRTRGGLPDAFLAERNRKLFIAMGSFADPADPDAKKTLERVQRTEVNGRRPYAYAFLAPPSESGVTGRNPAFDLKHAKREFGPDALYTLQVAIYGHADGHMPTPEELELFRDTAEKAVRELRAEGELAFYHHGPTRSSVTVGVFGPDDHDASVRPPLESPSLEQARERHPYNLLNGEGIKERVRTSDGRVRETMQKSFLVAIPG